MAKVTQDIQQIR